MAKEKVYGKCYICGEKKELTFEHIPPRAAFNHLGIKLYDWWGYLLCNNSRYTKQQKGTGSYSLCSTCNNLTGEWYGAAYAEFAKQGMEYYKSNTQGVIAVPYTIYPLRVFKQIVSCFASVNGYLWCEQNPKIRNFLLNPQERDFPLQIDILMYMQKNSISKSNGIMGTMNTQTGERFVGSEWAHQPFGYLCVNDKNFTNNKELRELYSINSFLNYGYEDRETLYLKIPKKICNPTILDFREGVPDIETIITSSKREEK